MWNCVFSLSCTDWTKRDPNAPTMSFGSSGPRGKGSRHSVGRTDRRLPYTPRTLSNLHLARLLILGCALAGSVISSIARADSPVTVIYGYDTQGRLRTASYSNGYEVTYRYDENGNRTRAEITATPSTPEPDLTRPTIPGNFRTTSTTPNSLSFAWDPSTDNVAVTGYQLERRCTGTNCSWAVVYDGTATTATNSGLPAGTTYQYRAHAYDAALNYSDYTGTLTVTTVDNVVPTAPGTPSFANITGSTATANWAAATDNVGVVGYEYQLNSGSWQTLANVLTVPLSGLSDSRTYSFAVRARDAAGNPGSASSNSFRTKDTTLPSAPGVPTFSSVTSSSAVASWGAASDNTGVTGYEYRLNSGAWQTVPSGTSVTLSGLSAGASYTFDVHAKDADGNVGAASTATLPTLPNVTLSNRNVQTQQLSGTTATFTLQPFGDIYASQQKSPSTVDVGDWLSPKANMTGFEARATSTTPTACTGSLGTWLSLNSARSWQISVSGGSIGTARACGFLLEIRHSNNPSAVLGSAQISITAVNAP